MCIIKMKLCGSIALAVGILIGLGHRAEGLGPAAVGLIQAGGSFLAPALTGVLDGDAKITVNITVENWTRFPMTNPSIRAVGGVVDLLPTDIEPATKEIMVARKSRLTATGSYGTVSWLVNVSGHKQRIVVMWSVPYDYNLYSNWLAVAVVNSATHPEGGTWFDKMYNGYDSDYNNFKRKEFRSHLDDLVFYRSYFKINARMGNGHKTQVTVEVRPLWDGYLAPTLRAALR